MVRPQKTKRGGALAKALKKARFECPSYLSDEVREHWLTACEMAPPRAGNSVLPQLIGVAMALAVVAGYEGGVPEDAKPTMWQKGKQEAVSAFQRAAAALVAAGGSEGSVSAAEAIFDRLEALLKP